MLVRPLRHLLESTTPTLRRLAACLALVVVMLHAREGAASTEFPKEIRDTLQLDCTPTCLLCHLTLAGGPGNLNSYGEWAGANRLIQMGPAAYYAEDSEPTMKLLDLDKDGVTDRDEIIANTTPLSKEDFGICSDAIYGCGAAQMAPGETPRASAWGLVAALGVAALLLRQLRRA